MKRAGGSSPQIMFVDNDPLVREGLNALKYQPIDVVVCDYFLPDMDGIQFLNKVGEHSSQVVRILMATLISDELRGEIQEANIDRIIEKPLTMACMDTIIHELCCHKATETIMGK